jgi:hypothetical protein
MRILEAARTSIVTRSLERGVFPVIGGKRGAVRS